MHRKGITCKRTWFVSSRKY